MTIPESTPTRCGTFAILGLPNAGKSTLLNALVGFKLAPVHAKPQMTRKNLLGIVTQDQTQFLFVDTPGFQERTELVSQRMAGEIRKALRDADAVVLLIARDEERADSFLQWLDKLQLHLPSLLVVSKSDLAQWPVPESVRLWAQNQKIPLIEISAKTGAGLPALLEKLQPFCSEQPFLYPADDVSDASLREIVKNIIMESLMEVLHQEIPYQCAVVIDEYKEGPPKTQIRATLILNRESQKGMVIGKGGQTLGKIGQRARLAMQEHLGGRVFLELFVKVDEGWIKNAKKVEDWV